MSMCRLVRLFILLVAILSTSCTTYRGVDYVVSDNVGAPSRRPFHHDKLVAHSNYCSAFNKKKLQPSWVAWTLTAEETRGDLPRSNNFSPDSSLRVKYQVVTRDYSGSGFDRGHLCPAADNKFSRQAMNECFYMTNMCPQVHSLNDGGWRALEDSCRMWAQREDSIVIVAGPVFYKKHPGTIGRYHKVAVPDAFFKVVLSLKPGQEKAIGFLFTNSDVPQTVGESACSVDAVEKVTRFNFFPKLSRQLQKKLECSGNLSEWTGQSVP